MDDKPTDSPEKGTTKDKQMVEPIVDPYREKSDPDVRGEISRMLDSAQHRSSTEPGSFMRQIYSDPDFQQPKSTLHIEEGASAHRCRDFPHMHHMMSLKVPGMGGAKGSKSSKSHHKHKHKAKSPKKEKVETYQPSLPQLDESPPKDEPDAIGGDKKYVDTGQATASASAPDIVDTSPDILSPPDVAVIIPDQYYVPQVVDQPGAVSLPIAGESSTDTPQMSAPGRKDETPAGTVMPPLASSTPYEVEILPEPEPKKAGFYIGIEEPESTGHLGQIQQLLHGEEEPMRSPRPGLRGLDPDVEASDVEDHRERKGGVTFLLGTKTEQQPMLIGEDHEDSDHEEDQLPQGGASYIPEERRESLSKDKHPAKKRKIRSKHVPSKEDLLSRRRKGSEISLGRGMKRVPTEKEEALTLTDGDLDGMASHRFEHMRSMSRPMLAKHSALASIVHLSQADKPRLQPKYDHSPHEMFVELGELHVGENREWQWAETARWIKFEEDVEEGANRWGKPHVASLSFHSLLELRRCIEQGAVLLDLEQADFPGVVNAIADELVFKEQIDINEKGAVMKALLIKHSHVTETKDIIRRNISYLNLKQFDSSRLHQHSLSNSSEALHLIRGSLRTGASQLFRKNSSFPSQPVTSQDGLTNHNKSEHFKLEVEPMNKNGQPVSDEHGNLKHVHFGSSHPDLRGKDVPNKVSKSSPNLIRKSSIIKETKRADSMPHITEATTVDTQATGRDNVQFQKSVLRRIPEGAEATSVLVGTVDFLKMPAMAFVRLSEGRNLGNLTEVPLPVRFLFVLLGPSTGHMDYHEIGRSISTLMANTMFHDVAYKAEGRQDLLDAINEFLDDSMVLPPGDWDRKTLLPVLEMAKKARLRKLKKKKVPTATLR